MNFALSEEQEAFREELRRFLEARSPATEVFRLMETESGYDAAVWKQMAEELGLQGVHVPEEYGGQGFGFLELGIVLEEMGRVMLCSPFFSTTCLGASAVLSAGSEEQKKALLPGIASGDVLSTLALLDTGPDWDPANVTLEARPDGDEFVLDGEKRFVLDGATAGLIVVTARLPGTTGLEGLTLLTLAGDAPGLTATPLATLDMTRKQADLRFEGVRAQALGEPGGAADALARTLDQAAIGLAAEMLGGSERCLEMAVAYARERKQFGRAIGSFQAIKHKAAEVLLEVECARSAAYYACWAAAEDNDERPQAASLAKAYGADAFLKAASENIQIHGGIGFTWEAEPHLYWKRAKVSENLFGDPVWHRARICDRLGL